MFARTVCAGTGVALKTMPPCGPRRKAVDHSAADPHLARGGLLQAGDLRRALSSPGGPEQDEVLALLCGQADVIDGWDVPAAYTFVRCLTSTAWGTVTQPPTSPRRRQRSKTRTHSRCAVRTVCSGVICPRAARANMLGMT